MGFIWQGNFGQLVVPAWRAVLRTNHKGQEWTREYLLGSYCKSPGRKCTGLRPGWWQWIGNSFVRFAIKFGGEAAGLADGFY